MKRILAFLLCAVLVLSGCASEEPYVPTGDGLMLEDDSTVATHATEPPAEQELELVYYPTESMNPLVSTDYTNRTLFSLIYQGLFSVDQNYNAYPVLCSRYSVSEDMRTYTFYIAGATFSDGSRLTESDVYASFMAAMESPYYKGRFLHIDQITLGQNGGITFSLDTACSDLPLLLDIPIVKSTEVEALQPVGTGPYYLEQAPAGLRLTRRNNWWCEADLALTADAIMLKAVSSPIEIRDAFEFENVGLVCANPGSDSYADYRCDYELWDCENGAFLYLGCNTESDLFSKQAVRSALTHAIDRDLLVEKFYRSFAHSASLPASPQSPFYSSSLAAKYAYDPEKFTQVLADNAVTNATVRLLVNKNDTLRLRTARAIGEMLEGYGLKVEMLELTGNDYLATLNARSFELYLGQTKLSPNMDLSPFFVKNGALRYGGMTDAACYAMCLEALANRGNYYNLHQTVMEDGRLVPLLFGSYSVMATRGLITGLNPSRDNVFCYNIGVTLSDALIPNE